MAVLTSSGSLRVLFFFNDTATTEIYTLSLHDALPICTKPARCRCSINLQSVRTTSEALDRKSTRLNSSHGYISYAVFCLKKNSHKTLIGGWIACLCRALPSLPSAALCWPACCCLFFF